MSAPLTVETHIPFLETLFEPWKTLIGSDYQGYRNHVYRMVQFCWALKQVKGEPLCEEDKRKIMIAAVFHDIGIWTENTLDYLEPSLPPAMNYLQKQQLAHWKDEIRLMITEHHKLRAYRGEYQDMVELFRQGDLIDFSLTLVKFDLPKSYISDMKNALPNAGFHMGLLKKGFKWFLRHPVNPVPMMKW
ncbi:MAG: hypothetical protein V7785_22320 [Bermanella sp.]